MSEQELKLHVPSHSRLAVEQSIKSQKHELIDLHALYFDTPSHELARSNIAIRLRLEGDHWVQTLKMPGINSLTRFELNHQRHKPVLDLTLYAGTPAQSALTQLQQPLELRYETIISRFLTTQQTENSIVEIAYDCGIVRAGSLELPVSEVEFELKSGNLRALFELGQEWTKKYDLILDLRSKAHRGDALANANFRISTADESDRAQIEAQEIQRFWAPRRAFPYKLNKAQTATQALISLTSECLDQICANAVILAEVDTANALQAGTPEHVHQLRIGMRRLTSNWSLFNKIANLPEPDLRQEMKGLLRLFGQTRDFDVILEEIMPKLNAVNMPAITITRHKNETDAVTARDIAQSPQFQLWLLRLLAWTVTTPGTDPQINTSDDLLAPKAKHDDQLTADTRPDATPALANNSAEEQENTSSDDPASHVDDSVIPCHTNDSQTDILSRITAEFAIIPLIPNQNPISLRRKIELKLNQWNKSIVRHWQHNDQADIQCYHDLRKKIKKMRYGLTVYECLDSSNSLKSYIKVLAQAQEEFGILNDYSSAYDFFNTLSEQQSAAMFALGWLSSQIQIHKLLVDKALKHIPKKIKFKS